MTPDLLRSIDELARPSVLVVGDLILDRYVGGHVVRISPEAPIQVLRHEREATKPGGMAAVASNLACLGADVRVAGRVGNDAEAEVLRQGLRDAGVGLDGVVEEPGVPTTVKTRFVATSQSARQQILRVDREVTDPPGAAAHEALLAAVKAALPSVDVVVLSDYAKGVLTGPLCAEIVRAARAEGDLVLVDPKGTDFLRYRGATALTPNRAEAAAYCGHAIESYEDAARAAGRLVADLDLATAFVTLDRDGLYVFEKDGGGMEIRTEPREGYDVAGAGDNVIAVLAYAMGGGAGARTAARLANIAGGIAVERFGVVTVGWDEIAARIAARIGGDAKLTAPDTLERLLESARRAGRSIVFTNGCFDILHPGHVDLLRRSRALGDLLVVGVNDDESVQRLKGASRPVNGLGARAAVLGGLAAVDYVVAFGEDTPAKILERVRPDVLVKGADWTDKGVVGREFVESYGGRVELLPLVEGHSTTRTIERMQDGDSDSMGR